MPDSKITALTAITTVNPATFPLVIVDTSDTSMAITGTTKKVTTNQLLGSGGTATLASATITGDLTVDTSVFKVNTTTDQVGIGTATPTASTRLDVVGGTFARFNKGSANQYHLRIGNSAKDYGFYVDIDNNGTNGFSLYDITASSDTLRYVPGASGSWTHYINGSTAMTLNSTGLGVGRSPLTKLTVSNGSSTRSGITITDGNTASLMLFAGASSDAVISIDANNLVFKTGANAGVDNGTTRMTLDSSGNVGIGVTPKNWSTSYRALQIGQIGAFWAPTLGNDVYLSANHYYDGTATKYIANGQATFYLQNSGSHVWYNSNNVSGTAGASYTPTQAMTLDASGRLLVNTSSVIGGSGDTLQIAGKTTAATDYCSMYTGTSTTVYAARYYHTSAVVGSITFTALGTAYNIASDYRLKESVKPLFGGLDRINALKPSTYKWKVNGSDGEGFIAHELAEVIPAAVTGQKDAVNEDGSIQPQQVDLSKIVPVLVSAIQELTARVQTLETR